MNSHSEEMMRKLRALKPHFGEMGLKRVRVFGSVARGDADENSDLDLIVDFEITPGLIRFIGVKHKFEDSLGCRVDMTTDDVLHRLIKDSVLQEARDV
jgi:uncharacterized protein